MSSSALQIIASATQTISASLVPSASAMHANATLSDGVTGQPLSYQTILAISATLTLLLVVLILIGMCTIYYRCRCRGCSCCGASRPHKFAAPPADEVIAPHPEAAGDGAREAEKPMSLCVDTDAVEDARQDALAITPPKISLGNSSEQVKSAIVSVAQLSEPPFIRGDYAHRYSDAASSTYTTLCATAVAQPGPPMLVPEGESHPPSPSLTSTRELQKRHSLACPPSVGGSSIGFDSSPDAGDVRLGSLQPRPGAVARLPVQPVGPVLPVVPVMIAHAPVWQRAVNLPHGQSDALQLARAAQRRGSLPLMPSHASAAFDRTAPVGSQPHLGIASGTGIEHVPGSGIGRRRASFLAAVASSVMTEQAGGAGSRYHAGLLDVPGSADGLPRPGLVSRPQPVSNAWLVGPDVTPHALHRPLVPSMEDRFSRDSASVQGATDSDVITLASVNVDYTTQGPWAISPPGRALASMAAYRRQTIPVVPGLRPRVESGHVQLPPSRVRHLPAQQHYFGRGLHQQENNESGLYPDRHDSDVSSTVLRNALSSGALALASSTDIGAPRVLHSPENLAGRGGRWADAMSRSSAASIGPAVLASRTGSQAAMAAPSSLRGRRVSV